MTSYAFSQYSNIVIEETTWAAGMGWDEMSCWHTQDTLSNLNPTHSECDYRPSICLSVSVVDVQSR